MVFNRYLAFV